MKSRFASGLYSSIISGWRGVTPPTHSKDAHGVYPFVVYVLK